MTMVLLAWAILMTVILFGDKGLSALSSGRAKVASTLEGRKEKRKAIESHVDEKSAADLAHQIRAAEIEAEMHLQGNGFVLTTCENNQCDTCYPGRFEPASGYEDRKVFAGWPGSVDEYRERERRLKARRNTTIAGAAAKAGGYSPKEPRPSAPRSIKSDNDIYDRLKRDADRLKKDLDRYRRKTERYQEEYTIVSGAGERITGATFDYIIVNNRSYRRPSSVPAHAKVYFENTTYGMNIVWYWTTKDGKRRWHRTSVPM